MSPWALGARFFDTYWLWAQVPGRLWCEVRRTGCKRLHWKFAVGLPGGSHADTGWNNSLGDAAMHHHCRGWCCSAKFNATCFSNDTVCRTVSQFTLDWHWSATCERDWTCVWKALKRVSCTTNRRTMTQSTVPCWIHSRIFKSKNKLDKMSDECDSKLEWDERIKISIYTARPNRCRSCCCHHQFSLYGCHHFVTCML